MSRTLGMLAVLLALVSQLALGSLVLPDDLATLDAVTIACAGDTAPSDAPPVPKHTGDYCLCPLSVALALPAVILTPAPLLPEPAAGPLFRRSGTVQARAPPSHRFAAAFPRGPPRLV